jgi:hypothetical protein
MPLSMDSHCATPKLLFQYPLHQGLYQLPWDGKQEHLAMSSEQGWAQAWVGIHRPRGCMGLASASIVAGGRPMRTAYA